MEDKINVEGDDEVPVALCDNITPDIYSKTVILGELYRLVVFTLAGDADSVTNIQIFD